MNKRDSHIYILAAVAFPEGMAGTKRVRNYAISLSMLGYAVSVVTFSSSQAWVEEVVVGDITLKHYTLNWRRLLRWRNLLHKSSGMGMLLVYSGLSIQNLPFAIVARRLGYKIVVDYVEDFRYHQENVSLLRKVKILSILVLERYLDRLVDGLVVISSHLKSKFHALYKGRLPLVLVPISAEVSRIQRINSSRDGKQLTLLYSGSFGNKDGLHYVASAVKELFEEGISIKLQLTGSQENFHNISLFNGHKAFEFMGFLREEDLRRVQSEADILLMTRVNTIQNIASFPFKLGEYLATGNLVIATNVGDVGNYLKNHIDSLLIEPESVLALKDAIKWAYHHPEEAKEIGRRGKEKCEAIFGLNTVQQNLVDLMGQIGFSEQNPT